MRILAIAQILCKNLANEHALHHDTGPVYGWAPDLSLLPEPLKHPLDFTQEVVLGGGATKGTDCPWGWVEPSPVGYHEGSVSREELSPGWGSALEEGVLSPF